MFSKDIDAGYETSAEHLEMAAAYGATVKMFDQPNRQGRHGRVTYGKGLTVRCLEKNGYDDSDFSVVVYNQTTDNFDTLSWGTTRFWCYDMTSCVSATPEIFKLYNDRCDADREAAKAKAKAEREAQEARRNAQREALAYIPSKGDRVTVLRGKNKGKAGRVFWIGESKSSRSGGDLRYNVGVQLDDVADAVFVNANLLAKA